MQEAQTARSELLPYTVVWHQKGEKPYAIERLATPGEVSKRLDYLWRHDHREAAGVPTGRTDFAIALVWRFIERDRYGRRERLEEQRQAAQ